MDLAVLGHESRGLQTRIRQGFRVRVFRMTICLAHISALQYWRAVRCGFRPKPRAARIALPAKNEPERNRVFARRAMDERSVFTVPATDSHCDFGAKWQKEQTWSCVPRYLRCRFRGKSDAHRRKDVRAVARGTVSPACSLLIGRSSCSCCVRTVRVVFNEARWL